VSSLASKLPSNAYRLPWLTVFWSGTFVKQASYPVYTASRARCEAIGPKKESQNSADDYNGALPKMNIWCIL